MKCLIVTFFLLLSITCSHAQLTLEQCEAAFRQNNLNLLAEQYNISAAQAAVIQARIWEQPQVTAELNALNPQDRREFDIGPKGQKALAIQQLIYLGGKKKNEVEFAKSNVLLAEIQYEQLLIALRYQLHYQFYSLYFDQQKIESLSSQVTRVDTLVQAYAAQVEKGNLPLKDLVRLQSLGLSLKNDLISLRREVLNEQRDLTLLTGLSQTIVPQADPASLMAHYSQPISLNVDELLDQAKRYNPEYISYQRLLENQQLYLTWQKSLATPDLTAGLSYDQRGGAFTNQVNLTLGIPLPLWNRNRGNIKIAEAQLSQSRVQKEYKEVELRARIQTALLAWEEQHRQYELLQPGTQNLTLVYDAIIQNFRKRNISIMEFTDFMESYSQAMLQMAEMRKQYILAGDALNQLVNSPVF